MAMQLEFAQAMSDFKTMFPDMDRDVIEAVLRANQGAVDATIDQLLAMSTDNQNEKLRNELDGNGSPQRSLINLNDGTTDATATTTVAAASRQTATAQLIDMTDGPPKLNSLTNNAAAAANAVLLDLNDTEAASASPHTRSSNTGASPKQRPLTSSRTQTQNGASTTPSKQQRGQLQHQQQGSTRRWNPPILRPLPSNFLRIMSPAGSHDTVRSDFDLPDEQFAMMLQNEEFMNQLRWNQEFMSALEKEQSGKAKTEDDAAFKERLKNMGKMSRKKFLQMARVFTWQRNKKVTTAKQIDSLPLKEEPSDDEEHNHQHHHQQQQQHSEQQQQNSIRK